MKPEEVKKARNKLGLTQSELADLIGTKQARVSDWENGKYPISRPFVILITILLNQYK